MEQVVKTELNVDDPDDIYELFIGMHEGLSEAQSHLVNARLILLLANQIGDRALIEKAVAMARDGVGPDR